MLRAAQITLYTADIERSIAFYSALGLTERFRYAPGGDPVHVELELGGWIIGIATVEAARADHGLDARSSGRSIEVVFWCDDALTEFDRAVAGGAPVLSQPHEFQDHLRVAWVADPDGNPVQFVQEFRRQPTVDEASAAGPAGTDVGADEVTDRVFQAGLGAMETLSIHIGDRLGWYRALVQGGPMTSAALAAATGTDERYTREWLEQQAVAGLLHAAGDHAESRTFSIDAATAEALTDATSIAYIAPLARLITAAAVRMPELLDAYRSGGGVGWAAYGADMREAQADLNRPWFESMLTDALGGVPELAAMLARPGARLAEIGFGGGWASIALARAYPEAHIEGFDVDAESVQLARANASAAGVGDRIDFRLEDGTGLARSGPFDVIFAFECVHDMAQPVAVLAAARSALAPDGVLVVMDEAVADEFAAPGDATEQAMYGFSLLVCLPDGRSHEPSEATGTVMRRSILEGYARRAGFTDVEVLPIDDFADFRFYALR